ncbi:hypothetical protein JXA32_15045 [Candidatus Sumerlaeota bacterium]|nr:hypothetical protein [Candidatus Sumerlaeota bacterium]
MIFSARLHRAGAFAFTLRLEDICLTDVFFCFAAVLGVDGFFDFTGFFNFDGVCVLALDFIGVLVFGGVLAFVRAVFFAAVLDFTETLLCLAFCGFAFARKDFDATALVFDAAFFAGRFFVVFLDTAIIHPCGGIV